MTEQQWEILLSWIAVVIGIIAVWVIGAHLVIAAVKAVW